MNMPEELGGGGFSMLRQVLVSEQIGRVTKTERSPPLIATARRNCCSESGPRMRPSTAGTSGMSKTRIVQPTAPTA